MTEKKINSIIGNVWNNCKFKDNNCCGYIKMDSCPEHCDLMDVKYDKDSIIEKCVSELKFVIDNKKDIDKSNKVKNSIYGFLLLSGLLFEHFEYNIKKDLTLKQKIFLLRNNIFKKL